MARWRYLAQIWDGDGPATWFDWDLPLSGAQVTTTLSGPGGLSGTVPVEAGRLKRPDGQPLLAEWGAAVWAEADGQIRGGGIVTRSELDGPSWALECVGISGYVQGLPWTGTQYQGIQVDPLAVVRAIWARAQANPGGDLGVLVDSTTSPVRVGTAPEQVEFQTGAGTDVAFEAGPLVLAWWQTPDMGKVVDDLASGTPFDYLEETAWGSGDALVHRLRLGYPRLGRRRDDLRFVIGENVSVVPAMTRDGDNYASEVLVLGAGEGRKQVNALVPATRGRLRRVAVVTDSAIRTHAGAVRRGRTELAARTGAGVVEQVVVRDHPHAPLGSWTVGDDIRVSGSLGWAELDTWVRVVGSSISPEAGDVATLRVVPA